MGISVGMGWSINEGCVNYYEAFKEEGGYGNVKLFDWVLQKIGDYRVRDRKNNTCFSFVQ